MASIGIKYKNTFGTSSLGNVKTNFSIFGTCSCDIWPFEPTERIGTSQDISEGQFYISVPWDEVISVDDKIEIDGIMYSITFVPDSMTWLTNKRLEAKNYNGN